MIDYIPMTQAGYDKIKAEVDRLENTEMPAIAEKIAEARAEGDLRENAEYHACREKQGLTQAKINLLRDKLSRATIMNKADVPHGEVAFGCTVKVKDLDYDDEEIFTLVGAGEEDYDTGKILITSPIGQGLLGKKIGETAEISVPKGTLKFQVVEISWDD